MLAVKGICTHVEGKQVAHRVILCKAHTVKAYLVADKAGKLIWRDLTQTFESGNLRLSTTLLYSIQSLLLRVAVEGLLFISYTEQRRLHNKEVTVTNKVREVLQEECQ